MSHRILAAALVLFVLGGFAAAETHLALITELSDSKLTMLSRKKGEKKPVEKKLDVADKVVVVKINRKGEEKLLSFSAMKRVVGREKKGVFAKVSTDSDKVVRIEIRGESVPEKAAAILAKADRIELYSLEPNPDDKEAKAPGATFIEGALVLGKTVVKDKKTLSQVREALDLSVGIGSVKKCFDPRHAVRATAGNKTMQIVICFHCGQAWFFFDEEKDPSARPSIGKGMQVDLDKILKDAGVSLGKEAKE